jgi:hypothetical protein
MKPVPATTLSTRRLLRVPEAARRGERAALAAFVGGLVIGILGMHALATHTTTHNPAVPAAASTMAMAGAESVHPTTMAAGDSSATEGHGTVAGAASTHDTGAHLAPVSGSNSRSGSGHDPGAMVMLCVVMLAAAALTLLVLLTVRAGVRPLLPAAFHPAAARPHTLQWVRGTGPPHEWQFSVIRC